MMQRLRQTLRPWRALCLAALLLAAQTLGLVHAVAHAKGAPTAGDGWGFGHAHAHAHAGSHSHADGCADAHADSEASAECRLYDQLLVQVDVLLQAPEAAMLAGAMSPLHADGVPTPGRQAAAAYQARAPPAA